ncbi:MAG TPA: UDP-N-acetylmuramoyl-L-alanyl-D-glutamate--2,6-diaminopimelate ligase [Bryobacteraceae bacterium]|nr:UDP-N-acetylmuramoyl-L-alanyl-D-glutamate--2,6-diaminopimelate ligase [Bryobacteraceae bacterium]
MIRAGVRRKTENAGIGRTRRKAEERANSRLADAGRETGKAPVGSMTLQEVLSGVRLRAALPPEVSRITVAGLEYDSRRIAAGELFFAFQGQNADGRSFAREAVKRGAPAVVSELPKPEDFTGVWIEVEHGREAMALASRNFFGAPDERIVLTGITGTNGKTTTSYLLDAVLRAAGKITALVGTIEYQVAGEVRRAVNTTPDSLDIVRILSELERKGGTHATMEVSSHALALGRVYGVRFHTAVFTNLTRDHLDFHRTMEAYFGAKRTLFEGCGAPPPRWAVLNEDDEYGRSIATAPGTERITYAIDRDAMVRARNIEAGLGGLTFAVETGNGRVAVRSPLVGRINVYNILAAFGAGLAHGIDAEAIAAGIEQCRAVPGRFERVDEGQPFLVVVDYAHTDDALRNVIRAGRELSPRRVITLFGCGGDRDRAKRPLMGAAAAELSDFVVLTSDNPRSEDPLAIMNDAMVGLRRYDTPHVAEPDRERAIRRAIEEAGAGDLVLIAGKGHETYQVLRDRTIPFDDREVVRRILRGFGYRREGA